MQPLDGLVISLRLVRVDTVAANIEQIPDGLSNKEAEC